MVCSPHCIGGTIAPDRVPFRPEATEPQSVLSKPNIIVRTRMCHLARYLATVYRRWRWPGEEHGQTPTMSKQQTTVAVIGLQHEEHVRGFCRAVAEHCDAAGVIAVSEPELPRRNAIGLADVRGYDSPGLPCS